MKHSALVPAAKSALLLGVLAASHAFAGNVELGSYTGTFTNLDPNAGSYMFWTVEYGDPNVTTAIYYPINMMFNIDPLESVTWSATGAGTSDPVSFFQSCGGSPSYCDGSVRSGDYYIFQKPAPQFGYYSKWYFVDVYYPGSQSFTFNFTDPPAGPAPASVPISLVSRNYLANGTQVGPTSGFSLILDPGGNFHDVVVNNMTLSGPGIASSTPEPGTVVPALFGLATLWFCRRSRG